MKRDLCRAFHEIAQHPVHNRRWFFGFAGSISSLAILSSQIKADSKMSFSSDPFSLGVASGDPDHQSVVLWTRLAPAPLEPRGGMPPQVVDVQWELADDEVFQRLVQSGTAAATPQLGHSVHVEVAGLQPDRWYWYRFRCGDAQSVIGRTRTLPDPGSTPERMKFAFASCQNYEQGLFTAYEQMVRDQVDLVFHLGDYIYEYEASKTGKVRTHIGAEIKSLDDYRVRHAQYRLDPLLSGMHAACPWFVTWDDHEFDNNYANDVSEERNINPADFLERRANAYQAYYEMMPVRACCMPSGSDMRLYRKASFGNLAEFLILDTRQYRSDQPNGDRKAPLNEAAMDSSQTMLGREQKDWLCQSLLKSSGTWNVLAQQVMMGLVNRSIVTDEPGYAMDQWPGYAFERMQLVDFLRTRSISNPVVLTGDIHSNWVNELRVDDRREESPLVAAEFVGTSISSGGNGLVTPNNLAHTLSANPCVKFYNAERGYVLCELTKDQWKSDYRVVDEVLTPGGKISTRATFVVEAGNPKVMVG